MQSAMPRQFSVRVMLWSAILSVLVLTGFVMPAGAEFKGRYPYKVGTTVGMIADIIRQVVGEKGDVTNIIGTGVDPHLFNPTRSDVAVLLRSDIVFYAGLLLEGQMTDVLVKISRRRPVYAVTELLKESYLIEDAATNHSDPHVWMDVKGWIKAVEVAAAALSEFDPANSPYYKANAASYLENLEALDAYAAKVIGSIPANQKIMVTAHDAFRYMGRAYGIEVMGIQGISTESEAGLKDINLIVDLLVERKIPAVFVESSVSDKNVKALLEGANSRGHKVRIGGELFSDAMGKAGTYEGTYIGMIDHNATIIARALGGQAPERGLNGKLAIKSSRKNNFTF